MAKYIRFEKDGQLFGGRDVYAIINKRSGVPIGNVFWYHPWRQWTVRFDEDSIWSQDCLSDVRDFILGLPMKPEYGKQFGTADHTADQVKKEC